MHEKIRFKKTRTSIKNHSTAGLKEIGKFMIILSVFQLWLAFPVQTQAQIIDDDPLISKEEYNQLIQQPKTRITIPGLNFTKVDDVENLLTQQVGPDGIQRTYISIPFLGQYIAAAYRYMIVIIGIYAMISFMNGGFEIVMSGGNPEKIQNGKKRIANSAMGLLLAVGSYVLLYNLNPELVKFKNLSAVYVDQKTLSDVVGNIQDDLAPDELGGPVNYTPTGNIPVPYISQLGNRALFGACGDIAYSGCGPTSLAMVLRWAGYSDAKPADLAAEWAALKYRTCKNPPPDFSKDKSCTGCSNLGHGGMFADKKFLEKYNHIKTTLIKKIHSKEGHDQIINALVQQKPIIASVAGPSIFTNSGHFIVLTGVNKDGTISVNDPSKKAYCDPKKYSVPKCPNVDRTIPASAVPRELIFKNIKAATIFEKID